VTNLPAGNLVPILKPTEVVQFSCGHSQLHNISAKAYSYFPLGPSALGFEMPDSSMGEIISRSEFVIIDPEKSIEPGWKVAVVVQAEIEVALPSPILVLREIQFLSTRIGEAPYDLAASGRGCSNFSIRKSVNAMLVGSPTVSIRRLFQGH